jgi:hypothetical protein
MQGSLGTLRLNHTNLPWPTQQHQQISNNSKRTANPCMYFNITQDAADDTWCISLGKHNAQQGRLWTYLWTSYHYALG